MTIRLFMLFLVALLGAPASTVAAAKSQPLTIPDFTKGDAIPAKAEHDWNLGPTGLRGWMFCDQMVTTDARQISITQVEKGSPADGVFLVGDVILGVGGKPFSYDPRTEFGKAITIAESEAGGGKLTVTRWRAGKVDPVVVRLPVLGSYGATAPYDCPKSKRILEQGCKALAEKVAKSPQQEDPIVRSLNALALLASGDPAYLPLVKKEAQWAAGFSENSMQTWYYGYVMILLSEYVLATGDQSVMPGLRRLALEAAKGQSAVGSWGTWVRETRRPPRRLRDDEFSGSAADHFAGAGARGRRERPGGGPRHRTQRPLVAVLHRQRGDSLWRPSPVD